MGSSPIEAFTRTIQYIVMSHRKSNGQAIGVPKGHSDTKISWYVDLDEEIAICPSGHDYVQFDYLTDERLELRCLEKDCDEKTVIEY